MRVIGRYRIESRSEVAERNLWGDCAVLRRQPSSRWRNVADSSKLSGEQNKAHRRSERVMPRGNLLGAVRTGNYRSQTMAFRGWKQRLFVVLFENAPRKPTLASIQASILALFLAIPPLACPPSWSLYSCVYHLASFFLFFSPRTIGELSRI